MPYDEQLLTFLRLDELLVDVGDDLTDYEDDVIANSFNIYRRARVLLLVMHAMDQTLPLRACGRTLP